LGDVLSTAVADVTAVLRRDLFAVPLAGQTYRAGGRVHPYPPAAPTAPCAWVEVAAGQSRFDETAWATILDVVVVADGSNDAGWELLYALADRVIALLSSHRWLDAPAPDSLVTAARARPVDVGGPNLRGLEVTVELLVPAATMCSDSLSIPVPATNGGPL